MLRGAERIWVGLSRAPTSQPVIPPFIYFLHCRSLLSQSTPPATASLGFLPIQIKFVLMALIEIGM